MKLQPKNNERDAAITDEVLALFRRGMEIRCEAADEKWEDQGGRRREFLDTCVLLDRALQRKPWQVSILDADRYAPPPPGDTKDHLRGWHSAMELREALEAALEKASEPQQ